MKFWKMNGAGNDFVIINNLVENIDMDRLPEIARILCERHMSIGADGFMAVGKPSEGVQADCRMLFFNNDGSIGEMCGNGARCISRYCLENGIGDGDMVTIETTAGIVTGKRINKQLYRIRLNDPSVIETEKELEVDGVTYNCSYVVLGDPGIPHIAVDYPAEAARICGAEHLKDADRAKLFELGRKLRFHPDLPKGANVNFYEMTGENELDEMTYERGVEDFTYACGTGTGSVVTALTLMDRVSGENVKVNVRGGELYVDVEEVDETGEGTAVHGLYLTGPTNIVCKGEVTDENLC
ncbi:MAG: diaminopimelate epimerase [Eubacteriales bacterium]|nr:diaminopimelate epimerase [Eubacteriales bacterium]